MKILTLVLTVLCFTTQTLAKDTVLLISPLVRLEERNLPEKLDKNYQSYSKYYLEEYPKEKNIERLLNEFENAQKYFLVQSNELARQYYERVVSYSDMDEWKDVHRKIIYLSFIRLSELNPENQEDWILQALRFSLDTDPRRLDLNKDTLKKVLSMKDSFSKKSINWQVSQFKSDFSFILINGHVIDLNRIENVKIPSGKFRITFLSDVYKLQTYQVSSQQIPLLVPTRIPFVSGTCEKPFVNNEGEIKSKLAVYYSKNCIKNQNGRKWIAAFGTKGESRIEQDLTPVPAYDFTSRVSYNNKPFYKETWFLVAAGIVTTSLLVSAYKDSKKEKPTHETVNGF